MLRFIIAAVGGAVAVVVEQDLTGVTNTHRVIVAAVALIPFTAVYFWLELRARSDAAGPAPQRPTIYGRPR